MSPPADDLGFQRSIRKVIALEKQVLRAVAECYAVAGVYLPARRIRTAGPPSWDCELVAVYPEGMFGYQGDIAVQSILSLAADTGWAIRGVTMAVEIVRKTPQAIEELVGTQDGEGPWTTEADENAAADLMALDSQIVLRAIMAAYNAEQIGHGGRNDLAFVDWQMQGPAGGFIGSVLRFRVGLTAIEPED